MFWGLAKHLLYIHQSTFSTARIRASLPHCFSDLIHTEYRKLHKNNGHSHFFLPPIMRSSVGQCRNIQFRQLYASHVIITSDTFYIHHVNKFVKIESRSIRSPSLDTSIGFHKKFASLLATNFAVDLIKMLSILHMIWIAMCMNT